MSDMVLNIVPRTHFRPIYEAAGTSVTWLLPRAAPEVTLLTAHGGAETDHERQGEFS